MKRNKIKLLTLLVGFVLCFANFAYSQNNGPGIFDGHSDIGTDVKPGDAIWMHENSKTQSN